jgi:hypothetical protein
MMTTPTTPSHMNQKSHRPDARLKGLRKVASRPGQVSNK